MGLSFDMCAAQAFFVYSMFDVDTFVGLVFSLSLSLLDGSFMLFDKVYVRRCWIIV